MHVQINIHGDKDVPPGVQARIEEMMRDKLERFDDLFTRIELHIARNESVHARMEVYLLGIEGRAAGKPPPKVRHGARRPEPATEGAIVKLIMPIERRVARKRTVSRKGHVL